MLLKKELKTNSYNICEKKVFEKKYLLKGLKYIFLIHIKEMYDDKHKKSIYKWRENNKEMYNSYCAGQMRKQYEKNKEAKLKTNAQYQSVKKEFRKFLNILIDI